MVCPDQPRNHDLAKIMKNKIVLSSFFALAFFSLFCWSPLPAHCDIVDRVVAVVGEDVITLSEVNEEGRVLFSRIVEQVSPSESEAALQRARDSVIRELIDRKILEQKAREAGIKVKDAEVEAALQRVLERNHTTREQFNTQLAEMGMTEQQYRQGLKTRILRSKLINREVRSKIVIPEKDIIDYYDTHYTEQIGDGGYYILQIGCTIKNEASSSKADQQAALAEAKARAERVRALALSGHDFKELAKKYSDLPSAADGGDIGVFTKDEMAPYMRDAVTGLQPGQVSEVIQTPAGFQIFKLLSSQEGEIITKIPFKEARDEIREILYEQKMKEQYEQWLQSIRDQVYIKIL